MEDRRKEPRVQVLCLWPLLQELQWEEHRKLTSFRLTSEGPKEVVAILTEALEQQWRLGYPLLPPPEEQLTHGLRHGYSVDSGL